jgi:hypothetical protein
VVVLNDSGVVAFLLDDVAHVRSGPPDDLGMTPS